jgi:selenide, water dikinase
MNREQPQREVVLLGAGHTHLHILRMWGMRPIAGVRLTCVSNQHDAVYSGMLPGTLAGNYEPEQARIDLVRRCAAVGARLVLAETTGLDRAGKRLLLRDRPPIPYDCLSIGIGSRPAAILGDQHAVSIKPMQTFLQRLEKRLKQVGLPAGRPLQIAVIGGGAGGVEISLCLPSWMQRCFPSCPFNLSVVDRGERILTGGSDNAAKRVQQLFDQRGCRTLLQHDVVAIGDHDLTVENQNGDRQCLQADVVLRAVGAVGPSLFENFDLSRDAKGFLLTNIYLQSIDDDSIFVVGDSGTCQQRPHPKAGVYAVRQGPILWDNLRRSLQGYTRGNNAHGKMLRQWKPQSRFLSLLNTGDDQAILEYKSFAAQGRWCWRLKDFIDRRFMSKHQD